MASTQQLKRQILTVVLQNHGKLIIRNSIEKLCEFVYSIFSKIVERDIKQRVLSYYKLDYKKLR